MAGKGLDYTGLQCGYSKSSTQTLTQTFKRGYQSEYLNFFVGKFSYRLTLRRFRGVPVLIL